MKKTLFIVLIFTLCLKLSAQNNYRQRINLQGEWEFALDSDSIGVANKYPLIQLSDKILLPGTTDTNKKGNQIKKKDETTHLSRLYSYFGKAWYKKSVVIPKDWRKKDICLYLERTKPTDVYIDGVLVGHNDDITTAQIYNLSNYLKPGKHIIAIMVDNGYSVPKQLLSNSHAYTEDTQTNWNGIIGNIYLEVTNSVHISNLQLYPDAVKRDLNILLDISNGDKIKKHTEVKLSVIPVNSNTKDIIASKTLYLDKGESELKCSLSLGDSAKLWSEFHPDLYKLNVEIAGTDTLSKVFGLVDFKAQGNHFYVNGHETFLRGKHDACVFPLIGHTAMDVTSWRKYFQIAKQYGINHYRFHSWCPPEACFEAADIEGIYLQPELPFWGDFNKSDKYLMTFLKKEGINMLNAYGSHPSFVMMALGNELWGDIPTMKSFVDTFKTLDNRHLYTFGSNYYLGFQGYKEGMDYFTTCRIGGERKGEYNTHTRGSFSFADVDDGGYINHTYPNTEINFDEAIKGCPVPVISHETGQFQTYPDYNEIKKYTGVLYPYNMEIFRNRLQRAGMLQQASDFHKASGLWSVELYKADIEMDLRTKNLAGFHLLDLQDYPGQGSAYVGILDAFMETKGITTPKEWRQFCSPIVPLFVTDKLCYKNTDTFNGNIEIANYSEYPLQNKKLNWCLSDENEVKIAAGSMSVPNDSVGLFNVGTINESLSSYNKTYLNKASRLNLVIDIDGTSYKNTYPIWVYPDVNKITVLSKGIIVTDTLTGVIKDKLTKGAKVLWFPSERQFADVTVGPLFQTDYWNYRMFKTISENNHRQVSPGTLGILTDPAHPIFADYPTECHTNWQWFPVIKNSHPIILDNMPGTYRPIVQVIDNIERNHKLGLIFELGIGKGKLLICMSDLRKIEKYPEAAQLYQSILEYMHTDKFNPDTHIALPTLMYMLSTKVDNTKIDELKNISYE